MKVSNTHQFTCKMPLSGSALWDERMCMHSCECESMCMCERVCVCICWATERESLGKEARSGNLNNTCEQLLATNSVCFQYVSRRSGLNMETWRWWEKTKQTVTHHCYKTTLQTLTTTKTSRNILNTWYYYYLLMLLFVFQIYYIAK